MQHLPETYPIILEGIKAQIQQARLKAIMSANAQLLELYWRIGASLQKQRQEAKWGDQIIKRLSDDLRREFPDLKGFSARNILYMLQFATAYPDFPITQLPVAQLPWAHHVVLLDKVKDETQRSFYIRKSL